MITPSLPTFSIASAMRLPMCSSPEEMAPTLAMSSIPETGLLCFFISSTAADAAFSIASAMRLPMCSSPEEMAPTLAMSSIPETGLLCFFISSTAADAAFCIPFFIPIGLAPAARFLSPSPIICWARRVAVVVPSPAISFVFVETSRMSCAPMFSNTSSSSISLAIVTPSLAMRGAPNFLPSTTLRPLGPKVMDTVSASLSTPIFMALRASSP